MPYKNIPEKFNITRYLIEERNLKMNRANKVALWCRDKSYTYGEVSNKINQFSNYLKNLGLTRKDRIGLLLPDSAMFIFLFLGAIQEGIVPVLINPKISEENKNKILDETKISYLFISKNEADRNFKIKKSCIVHLEDEIEKINEMPMVCALADTTRDDEAFIIYTSGSNGRSKGVVHLQHDMLICSETYGVHVLQAQEDDIFYTHSKLSFAFGLGCKIFLPFFTGASSVVYDEMSVYDMFDTIKQHAPTIFMAVPVIYRSLGKMVKDGSLFSSFRVCVSAGELLPKAVAEDWKKRFDIDIIQGIGSTETLFLTISNTPACNRAGSVGRVLPQYAAKILDENGKEILEHNVIGELYISGESIMSQYLENSEETKKAMIGEGVKTGDKVYFDQDGYFWYVGRNTDTFKVNGAWASLGEIESAISQYPNVSEVLAFGNTTEAQEVNITAYIVPEDKNIEWNKINMKHFIVKSIGRDLCPKKIFIVEKIPKGPTGKKLRRSEKDLAAIGEIF